MQCRSRRGRCRISSLHLPKVAPSVDHGGDDPPARDQALLGKTRSLSSATVCTCPAIASLHFPKIPAAVVSLNSGDAQLSQPLYRVINAAIGAFPTSTGEGSVHDLRSVPDHAGVSRQIFQHGEHGLRQPQGLPVKADRLARRVDNHSAAPMPPCCPIGGTSANSARTVASRAVRSLIKCLCVEQT